MHLEIVVTLLLAIVNLNNSENKFDTFKDSQNQGGNNTDDPLKEEIKKYLSECDADGSEERYSGSQNSNKNSDGYLDSNYDYNSGRYHNHDNGNSRDQNQRNSRNRNSNGSNGYSNGFDSYNGQNYGGHNYYQNRDSSTSRYGGLGDSSYVSSYDRSRNTGDNRNRYGSYDSGGRNYDMNSRRNGYDIGSYSSTGQSRYGYGGSYVRGKRADSNEDASECLSQCVFGYLEVLDDNRSPSESAIIKWLQDNMPNDGKRIKAVRDVRRCFARLASSDDEDGCQFSKSLAKCLKLKIDM